MKKRIIALLLCFITLFSLVSCGSDLPEGAEPPEGMQYAGGAEQGFFMYVPEEWTLSSIDSVVGAFVSTLDHSSVSLARVEKVQGVDIDTYFKTCMEDMPFENYKLEKEEGVSLALGNIPKAKGYEYTYTYKPYGKDAVKYRAMQILGEYKNRLYVFTYTASDEKKTEDKTYFQTYIEKVNSVIENIKFLEPQTVDTEKITYAKDADGYLLVTKKRASGFDFYMNPAWKCTLSSGFVEAVASDGASINLCEARDTGVVVSDYFKKRKSDLERYTDGAITVIKENDATDFGNADQALAYEYTYTYRGKTYHTYQVILLHEKIPLFLKKGYVFTYTATEENYGAHIDEVKKMIGKVRF